MKKSTNNHPTSVDPGSQSTYTQIHLKKPKFEQGDAKINIIKIRKSRFEQGDLLIHQQFTRYGTNAKEWTKKCALLLPEIERRKIWQKKSFKDIYEYAAKLAGMNKEKVDDSLWILRGIEGRSALMEVAKEKGLGAVRPVVTIATQETEEFWAEKAKEMSKHVLETYVRDVREGRSTLNVPTEEITKADSAQAGMFNRSEFRPGTESQPEKVSILMSLDPEVANELEKLNGKGDWNELMKEFLKLRKEKLEEQKPELVKTESRHVPAEIQRYAMEKTKGICAFPGCKKEAENLHHTQRFSLEKIHDPDKVVPLCQAHHAIAHQGLIENENLEPKFWKVRKEPERASLKFWVDRKVLEHKKSSCVACAVT